MSISTDGIGMTSLRTRERLIKRLREQGICDARVLDALRNVPRHQFIDEALASRAYEDTALPIAHGQTISQPYIVARMTEAMLGGREHVKRVLEIGTGSGYQTVILAALVEEVFSVERIEPLMKQARRRIQDLGYRNVRLRLDDGGVGWPEYAPYDGILVTAAAGSVPSALIAQLAPGGRLVIPVGPRAQQELLLVTFSDAGVLTERLESVNFVPLVTGQAQ
jgi:protein-L-isoaspartate(D-aspartate) O-methyltransferase